MIAWLAHPDWGAVARNTLVPSLPSGSLVFLIIAIVGTTIAPWQLFFQQSCVAEKKLRFSDFPEFAFVTRSAVATSLHLFDGSRNSLSSEGDGCLITSIVGRR